MKEELKNDNTLVVQPVLPIHATNIDWITVANNKIDRLIQEQPHSEIVRHPKRPKTEEEAMTIMFDPRKASQTSTTQVIGMSPVDPIGEFVVGNAVLGKPLQLLGKGIMYGAGRYLPSTKFGNWSRAKIISRKMNDVVDEGLQYFGKVKYYGPTMGKTTAAKTNHDLVDFDDFTREAKNNLAKELNISTRVLQSDPKYALAYLEMLEKLLDSWRRNPLNTDKTLVISKKGLADKNVYNNEPSIPDRQTFVQRLRNRGETDDANSNDLYDMLLKQNPNLKIDNRFVSEIEYNPHYIGFQPPRAFYHYERNILPKTTPKTVTLEPKPIIKNNLTSHVQGEEAVKMFKEYGGVKIPEGSINGKELSTYVLEARIRYGLVGNTNISDQEIAEALYKHVNELGKNTKALNAQGEPLLLFRGDTKAYTELKDRLTPDELLAGTGTMDNSLGTLFLGDITTPDPSGVGRYLVGYKTTPYVTVASPSATGATSVGLYDEVAFAPQNWVKIGQGTTRRGPIGFTKAPAVNSSTGVNDLNAFVVKTDNVRNATDEIAVGNEILLINGKVGNYKGSTQLTGRQALADHYNKVLYESKASKQGLLKSDVNAPLRDEHSSHEYFALPNWNKHNAKHILPYDLRIPRNWSDPNIYKTIIPVGIGIGAATNK